MSYLNIYTHKVLVLNFLTKTKRASRSAFATLINVKTSFVFEKGFFTTN